MATCWDKLSDVSVPCMVFRAEVNYVPARSLCILQNDKIHLTKPFSAQYVKRKQQHTTLSISYQLNQFYYWPKTMFLLFRRAYVWKRRLFDAWTCWMPVQIRASFRNKNVWLFGSDWTSALGTGVHSLYAVCDTNNYTYAFICNLYTSNTGFYGFYICQFSKVKYRMFKMM